MPHHILVIHGGDSFEKYEDYLNSLRTAQLTLDRIQRKDWKARLGEVLGVDYEVIAPRMPNSQNARYAEWKIWFEKIVALLSEEIILIGHSRGGIFLAKYLSENMLSKKVRATLLVAAPYDDIPEEIEQLVDFNLEKPLDGLIKQGGQIFLYHSTDDHVVPFSNFERYQTEIPSAHVRVYQDRQHFNQSEFPEIVEDIRSITA